MMSAFERIFKKENKCRTEQVKKSKNKDVIN